MLIQRADARDKAAKALLEAKRSSAALNEREKRAKEQMKREAGDAEAIARREATKAQRRDYYAKRGQRKKSATASSAGTNATKSQQNAYYDDAMSGVSNDGKPYH